MLRRLISHGNVLTVSYAERVCVGSGDLIKGEENMTISLTKQRRLCIGGWQWKIFDQFRHFKKKKNHYSDKVVSSLVLELRKATYERLYSVSDKLYQGVVLPAVLLYSDHFTMRVSFATMQSS